MNIKESMTENFGRSGDCVVCYRKIGKYVLLADEESQKIVKNCFDFLLQSISTSRLNTTEPNIENARPFCKKCFDAASELTQLTEQVAQFQKEISDKKIALSLAVLFRRKQIQDGNKNSVEDEANSPEQFALLNDSELHSRLFSIPPTPTVPTIPTSQEVLEEPRHQCEMSTVINALQDTLDIQMNQEVGPAIETNSLVLNDSKGRIVNKSSEQLGKHNQEAATLNKTTRFDPSNVTEIARNDVQTENDTSANTDGVINSSSKLEVISELVSDKVPKVVLKRLKEIDVAKTKIISKEIVPQHLQDAAGNRKTRLQRGCLNKNNKQSLSFNVQKKFGRSRKQKITILCALCRKPCKSVSALMAHGKIHKGITITLNKCNFCNKEFTNVNDLNKHIRVHTKERPFKCSFCERTFSQSNNALTHERIHTGERPFKCSFCEKTFIHSTSLRFHERIHTGERPFKCSFCERTFSQSNNALTHERNHTRERPFKCSFCEKTFFQLGHARSHERIHTGEKPFKCSFCEKTFNRLSNARIHERIHKRKKL